LIRTEENSIVGDPSAIERLRVGKTAYEGTLMDWKAKGFWILSLATPLRGTAIPYQRGKTLDPGCF
jgi:hypothetical protein